MRMQMSGTVRHKRRESSENACGQDCNKRKKGGSIKDIHCKCNSNITERDRYGGPGVVVWEGIMLNGWIGLHDFDRDFVIGDRYCKEVILPHVSLFRGAIGPTRLHFYG
ncbi:transposable element Tcb2 transposase [Trichonephila clavipes]|nr:transposable element Tcb2 transposase [Trichonephila clavipes]